MRQQFAKYHLKIVWNSEQSIKRIDNDSTMTVVMFIIYRTGINRFDDKVSKLSNTRRIGLQI